MTKGQIRKFVANQIPVTEFQVPKHNELLVNSDDDAFQSCGICLSPFEQGEGLKVLSCKQEEEASSLVDTPVHMFHQDCITQWFYKKLECPMCRKSFKEDLIASVAGQEEQKNAQEECPGDNDVINLNDG